MADAYVRTRAGAINAAHSPLSIFLFIRLLSSLPDLIEADRDMIGMTGQDPAIDPWFKAAEAARATTLARLRDLSRVASGTALGEVGEIFGLVMTSDDPDDCAEMRYRAAHARQALLVPGTDRMAPVVNQMIHLALDQLETYASLEDEFVEGDAVVQEAPQGELPPDEGLAPAA